MLLRPYQEHAIQRVREEILRGHKRVLLVIATGGGKTVTSSTIIKSAVAKGKRCLFLAHRKELIDQCSKTLDFLGVEHGVIKRGHPKRDMSKPVQVASIQTLIRRSHWHADLVVIDEAHRSCAKTYKDILNRYDPNSVVLGLSGSPYRLDGKPLGEIYNSLVEVISTSDLVEGGFLIEPTVFGAKNVDISEVKAGSQGDYDKKELGKAMSPTILRGELLTQWAEKCGGALGANTRFYNDDDGRRRVLETSCDACTVIFAPNIEKSIEIVDQFKSAGIRAAHLDGKTKPKLRKQILDDLADGSLSVVSNVDILCVDEQTEILTNEGWKGIDELNSDHEVANWWPDQSITFAKPKKIIKRFRASNERMVQLNGKYSSIRVTEGHRMLYKKRAIVAGFNEFSICKASDLVGKRFFFPVSGMAIPLKITSQQPFSISEEKRNRLIVKRSHHLRANKGYGYEDSVIEARRRVCTKYSLRRKSPHELTLDECWFIGFWLGDGTCQKLQSGGVEYSISQSSRYSKIIKKLKFVFRSMGLDYISRTYNQVGSEHDGVRLSFPRGTGSGCQERNGVYHIEHYLDKNFCEELWGLKQNQLWAFLSGFWCADGIHGNRCDPGNRMKITNTNFHTMSQIQALCVCRGFHTSLCKKDNGPSAKKPIYTLNISRVKFEHGLVTDLLEFDSEPKVERVWCCNTDSTTIVTRRNGKVTIMGNCEGWDLPRLECVVGARPTRSKSLYKQMGGRLMRPNDDARIKFLLDHANWTRTHGFLTEPTEHSLTKAEKRPRKGKSKGETPYKKCPQCDAVYKLGTATCIECGYDWPKNEIEFTDEDLVELDGKMVKRANVVPLEERQAAFDKLASSCVEKQYKPNWARVRYQGIYGDWPCKQTGIKMPAFFINYERQLNKKLKAQMVAQAAGDAAK